MLKHSMRVVRVVCASWCCGLGVEVFVWSWSGCYELVGGGSGISRPSTCKPSETCMRVSYYLGYCTILYIILGSSIFGIPL